MGKSCVGSVWLSDGDGGQAIHLVCPCRNLLLDISFKSVNEPGLGSVGVVSIFRTEVYDAIPPRLESSKVSICCSIVRKPNLLDFFILKVVDEWSDTIAYIAMASGSPWVVSSWESSISPSMNSWMSSLYALIRGDGHSGGVFVG